MLDRSGKTSICFGVKHWDIPKLFGAKNWTNSGRVLLFNFVNDVDRLKLWLILGPGIQETRQRLFDMAMTQQAPFKPARKTLPGKWVVIYNRPFLEGQAYEETSDDEIIEKIKKQWVAFLENAWI
jgi:hypothetical protein